MFSYAAFNCELHADDTEVFWRMKLADCSQNRQPAKINFRPYGILLDPMQVRFRFNALCWEKKWFVELTLPGTPVNSTVPQQRSQLETLGRPLSVKTEHVHAARGWIQ